MALEKKQKKCSIGLSITSRMIELTQYSQKSGGIVNAIRVPTPPGVLDASGDLLEDPKLLFDTLGPLFKQAGFKVDMVNLSLPATLFRMVDWPKMPPEKLYTSLSSDAERYKSFDGTDAVVDFSIVDDEGAQVAPNQMRVIFGALRQDSLENYLAVLKSLKVKVACVSLEPVDILRGLAGTGVLDSLVEQIGTDAFWGSLFVDADRVRISLWQGSTLIEFRETHMETSGFAVAVADSIIVEDLIEEIRRTTKNMNPAIWLTVNVPPTLQDSLSQRLGVGVRECMLGPALMLADPDLSVAAVGSALVSTVAFPFNLNMVVGGVSAGTMAAELGASSGATEDDGATAGVLMGIGMGGIVVMALVSGVLALMATASQGEITNLQTTVDAQQQKITALNARQAELNAKVSVYQQLKEKLDEARVRNRICVTLTQDLRTHRPSNLWVQEINIGGKDYDGKIAMEGKALQHQDVIVFAKSFDSSPYINAMGIEQIQEQRLAGVPVFNYKIVGELNLNKTLITPGASAVPATDLAEPDAPVPSASTPNP